MPIEQLSEDGREFWVFEVPKALTKVSNRALGEMRQQRLTLCRNRKTTSTTM